MNKIALASQLEQIGLWFYHGNFVIFVVTGVIAAAYHMSAFQIFRTKALMLIVISYALGVFVTVFDHSIWIHDPEGRNQTWTFFFVMEFSRASCNIIGLFGALLFLRDFKGLASRAQVPGSDKKR